MPILTCRYCRSQCLDRDVMKIYDDPEEVNWFSSHYSKCDGVKESLKCFCGDLSKRCVCNDCNGCLKTPAPKCISEIHPKSHKEVDQLRTLEGISKIQEFEDYLTAKSRLMRLRNVTPLSDIVKTSK